MRQEVLPIRCGRPETAGGTDRPGRLLRPAPSTSGRTALSSGTPRLVKAYHPNAERRVGLSRNPAHIQGMTTLTRQPSGAPASTGGQFKTSVRAATDIDLSTPTGTLAAFLATDAEVDRLVHDAISSGLLGEEDPLGDSWSTPEIVLGHTPEGERVTATLAFSRRPAGQSVDHDDVPGVWEVSAQVWYYKGRWVRGGGRLTDQVREVVKFAPGVDQTGVAALAAVQSEHLNALNAGCAHQGKPTSDGHGRIYLASVPPCPHTGYRYGSAWLARAADPAKVADALAALGSAKKVEPRR